MQQKSSYYHTGRRFPLTENEIITEDEVWQTIERSKPGKAAGPDNISNKLMKGAMLFTMKLWTALYNKCLEITNIPKIWRESTVKRIQRKGITERSGLLQRDRLGMHTVQDTQQYITWKDS